MNRLDFWIAEWAYDVIAQANRSQLSGINAVEKILRDPGISSGRSRDRVLWWPRNPRIAKMSAASHQLSPSERLCLVVHFGQPLKEDNNVLTDRDVAKVTNISVRDFKSHVRTGKKKLRNILMNPKGKSQNHARKT
jgi:hypothetical protein